MLCCARGATHSTEVIRRCSTSALQSGRSQKSTMMHSTLSNSIMFKIICLGLFFDSFRGKAIETEPSYFSHPQDNSIFHVSPFRKSISISACRLPRTIGVICFAAFLTICFDGYNLSELVSIVFRCRVCGSFSASYTRITR